MVIIEESSKAEALKKLRESIEISEKYSRHDSSTQKTSRQLVMSSLRKIFISFILYFLLLNCELVCEEYRSAKSPLNSTACLPSGSRTHNYRVVVFYMKPEEMYHP